MSDDLSDLRRRMLARRRRSRSRGRAVGSLVLTALASGLGLAATPLWQHAGSAIQADWRDLFGVPAKDGPQRADPEPPASD